MKKILLGVLALGLAAGIVSCKGKYPGYKKSDNGLLYKIIKKGKSEVKPQVGDWLLIQTVVKTEKGTVLFDSRKEERPIYVPVEKVTYKGDFIEAFQLMSMGDSASFIVQSDSLVKHNQFALPDSLKKNVKIYFEIRVDSLITKAKYDQQMAAFEKKKKEMLAKMQSAEKDSLAKYIKDNKVTAKPTKDGLYIIPIKKGAGKQITDGKSVRVNYKGWTLDGRMFDTSVEEAAKKFNIYNPKRPYEPFTVEVGKGSVIKGWDLALSTLKVGDKVKLIIPSSLAYGEQMASEMIPPYSTLVFEIEVLEMIN